MACFSLYQNVAAKVVEELAEMSCQLSSYESAPA